MLGPNLCVRRAMELRFIGFMLVFESWVELKQYPTPPDLMSCHRSLSTWPAQVLICLLAGEASVCESTPENSWLRGGILSFGAMHARPHLPTNSLSRRPLFSRRKRFSGPEPIWMGALFIAKLTLRSAGNGVKVMPMTTNKANSKSTKPIHRFPVNRRSFLKSLLAVGATTTFPPQLMFAAAGKANPGERVNLACIGIGNRAAEDIQAFEATRMVNIVALCDVDMGAPYTLKTLKKYPNIPRFQNAEKMFDQLGSQIDAVLVAVPDFAHFPNAMLAMKHGKPVYLEKPMAHTFQEVELLMTAEKKYGVAAQMGNQGHSEANYFQFQAWTNAGIIKNVTRISAFMNGKRRWHGMKVDGFLAGQPVPETLDWDRWLATAPSHDYNAGYLNGDWRSWFEFGNGALGDWGAHIIDTAHEFLELGLPVEVNAEKLDGYSPLIFPQASTLSFQFPARGNKPPLALTWYDGQENLPPLPNEFGDAVVDPNIPPPSNGAIDAKKKPIGKVIYGEGLTFKGGSHGATLQIIPASKAKELASSLPQVPKSPSNHYRNFLNAVKGQEKCRSSFAVAGPLCQTMALGIIAQRLNARLVFDPVAKQITNHALANQLLVGPPPRKGWEQFYQL